MDQPAEQRAERAVSFIGSLIRPRDAGEQHHYQQDS
jgi:hypothetical protein